MSLLCVCFWFRFVLIVRTSYSFEFKFIRRIAVIVQIEKRHRVVQSQQTIVLWTHCVQSLLKAQPSIKQQQS